MTSQKDRRKIQNKSSILLSPDEKMTVFRLLGRHCQNLYTTVVQMYELDFTPNSQWKKTHTGVICIVKDNYLRGFFLRIYCLIANKRTAEIVIHHDMEVAKSRPTLLTFAGIDSYVGLNFALEDDCDSFYRIVCATIEIAGNRWNESDRVDLIASDESDELLANLFAQSGVTESDLKDQDARNFFFIQSNILLASVKQEEIKAATEPMPQSPPVPAPRKTTQDSNLKLNGSIGQNIPWVELTGSESDEKVKDFLQRAGVTESDLNDQETRTFILNFLLNEVNALTSENQEEIKTPTEPSLQTQQESKAARAATSRPSSSNATPATPLTPIAVSTPTSPSSAATTPKNNMRNRSLGWDKKRKLTKSDISSPTHPIHVSHVGWENHKGFLRTNSESDVILTNFLVKAGVSEPQQNATESRTQKPQIRLRRQVPHIPAAAPFPVPAPRNMLNSSFGLSVSGNNDQKDTLSEAPSRHTLKRVDLGDEALPDIFTRRLKIQTD